MRGDTTHHQRWVLPREHENAHGATVAADGGLLLRRVNIGEVDLHLFGEGTHRRVYRWLGAHVQPGGGVRFAVWAPNAAGVAVLGDWNGWQPEAMQPVQQSGVWSVECAPAVAGQCYKLAVTDHRGRTLLKADPMAYGSECPPKTASVIVAPTAHQWGDGDWMARRTNGPDAPLRIYEAHLGSWRHGVDNYRDLGEQMAAHVAALGFTHVELLPIAEHPFGGSWGYQVTGYYSPTARFGSPDDLRSFVDSMHAAGLGVIVDWVPAHFPKDEWSLARFDGTALYEHADPRQGEHPDWGTLVFNYGRHEVRNFLIANALYWLDEFHIDGLRVDAVASMLYLDYSRKSGEWIPNRYGGRENLDAIAFLQELNSVVGAEVPSAMMIAEESTAWPKVSHPVHSGGLGFTHKWNMGWMHDTLGYISTDPVHRKWHHRDLSFGLLYAFSERFVLPLSHDEVVHGKASLLSKAAGDDWQRFATLRALYAWMWAMPGAPLLFMGAELAPWHEWSESSSLPWHLLDHAQHRGVRDVLAALNRAAGEWPAVWERDHEPTGFQWLEADDADHSVYAFLRWANAGNHAVACIANFTPVPRPGYRVGVPWAGQWTRVVDTDHALFGGSGFAASNYDGTVPFHEATLAATTEVPWQGQSCSAIIDLPPLSVVWLAAHRP
jgi:1,4-alpha-glucan branching enzyme